jgi:hypothetical protein
VHMLNYNTVTCISLYFYLLPVSIKHIYNTSTYFIENKTFITSRKLAHSTSKSSYYVIQTSEVGSSYILITYQEQVKTWQCFAVSSFSIHELRSP